MYMTREKKEEVITFKVDTALAAALQCTANRSEFIRSAILAALDNTCPLCRGAGILNSEQQQHWRDFTRDHPVEECDDCRGHFPVCNLNKTEPVG